MAKSIRTCRVCGKEYPYCHTLRQVEGIFRWQDVACSPEHGSIYLARIRESRGEVVESESITSDPYDDPDYLDDEEDEYSALFEEDYDYYEDEDE